MSVYRTIGPLVCFHMAWLITHLRVRPVLPVCLVVGSNNQGVAPSLGHSHHNSLVDCYLESLKRLMRHITKICL